MLNDPDCMSIMERTSLGLWGPSYEQDLLGPYIRRLRYASPVLAIIGIGTGEVAFRFADCLDSTWSITAIKFDEQEKHQDALQKNIEMWGGIQKDKIKIADGLDGVCHFLYVPGVDRITEKLSKYYDRLASGGVVAGTFHADMALKSQLARFRNHNSSSKVTCPINVLDKNVWFWYKR